MNFSILLHLEAETLTLILNQIAPLIELLFIGNNAGELSESIPNMPQGFIAMAFILCLRLCQIRIERWYPSQTFQDADWGFNFIRQLIEEYRINPLNSNHWPWVPDLIRNARELVRNNHLIPNFNQEIAHYFVTPINSILRASDYPMRGPGGLPTNNAVTEGALNHLFNWFNFLSYRAREWVPNQNINFTLYDIEGLNIDLHIHTDAIYYDVTHMLRFMEVPIAMADQFLNESGSLNTGSLPLIIITSIINLLLLVVHTLNAEGNIANLQSVLSLLSPGHENIMVRLLDNIFILIFRYITENNSEANIVEIQELLMQYLSTLGLNMNPFELLIMFEHVHLFDNVFVEFLNFIQELKSISPMHLLYLLSENINLNFSQNFDHIHINQLSDRSRMLLSILLKDVLSVEDIQFLMNVVMDAGDQRLERLLSLFSTTPNLNNLHNVLSNFYAATGDPSVFHELPRFPGTLNNNNFFNEFLPREALQNVADFINNQFYNNIDNLNRPNINVINVDTPLPNSANLSPDEATGIINTLRYNIIPSMVNHYNTVGVPFTGDFALVEDVLRFRDTLRNSINPDDQNVPQVTPVTQDTPVTPVTPVTLDPNAPLEPLVPLTPEEVRRFRDIDLDIMAEEVQEVADLLQRWEDQQWAEPMRIFREQQERIVYGETPFQIDGPSNNPRHGWDLPLPTNLKGKGKLNLNDVNGKGKGKAI